MLPQIHFDFQEADTDWLHHLYPRCSLFLLGSDTGRRSGDFCSYSPPALWKF